MSSNINRSLSNASRGSRNTQGFYIPGKSEKPIVRKTSHGAILKKDREKLKSISSKPRIGKVNSFNSQISAFSQRKSSFNKERKMSNQQGGKIFSSMKSFGEQRKKSSNINRKVSENLLLPSFKKKQSFNSSSKPAPVKRGSSRRASQNKANALLSPSFRSPSRGSGQLKHSFSNRSINKPAVLSSSKPEQIKTQVSVKDLQKSISASFEKDSNKKKTSFNGLDRANSGNREKFSGLKNKIEQQTSFSKPTSLPLKKEPVKEEKAPVVVPTSPPVEITETKVKEPVKNDPKPPVDNSKKQNFAGNLNALLAGGRKPRKTQQAEVEEIPLDQAPKLAFNLQAEIIGAGKKGSNNTKPKPKAAKKKPSAAKSLKVSKPPPPPGLPGTSAPPGLPQSMKIKKQLSQPVRAKPTAVVKSPPGLSQTSPDMSQPPPPTFAKPPPLPSNPRPSSLKAPPPLPSNPRPSTVNKPPALQPKAKPSGSKAPAALPPTVKKMRMSERQKKNLRASIKGLKNLASYWDDIGMKNKKKQELNPFSEHFKGKREVADGNLLNSKSEQRAKQAQEWTNKEIDRVVQVIKDFGSFNSSTNQTMITFGELFLIYEKISDTLVFMLLKAKKRKRIFFDAGEMLLQGRDDHVEIYVKH